MLEYVDEYIVEKHEHEHSHLVLNCLLCGEDVPSIRATKCSHGSSSETSCPHKPLDKNVIHQVVDDVTEVRHEASNDHLETYRLKESTYY